LLITVCLPTWSPWGLVLCFLGISIIVYVYVATNIVALLHVFRKFEILSIYFRSISNRS
jgi:hypothetical protein